MLNKGWNLRRNEFVLYVAAHLPPVNNPTRIHVSIHLLSEFHPFPQIIIAKISLIYFPSNLSESSHSPLGIPRYL
ncbi:hypothetical protein VNO77_16716 [Canavalia gladiata]|uniref:Uncharacterized protein n=1 Tax=Canavalia gladiata TaxID=3824 RepID=A0AAN9QLZ2_CANGL